MVTIKPVREFAAKRADSAPSLSNWLRITRAAAWRTFAELRADFGAADQVGRRTVFNVAGNKYGLIARVNYQTQRVFVLGIMTHAQYAKGDWK